MPREVGRTGLGLHGLYIGRGVTGYERWCLLRSWAANSKPFATEGENGRDYAKRRKRDISMRQACGRRKTLAITVLRDTVGK